MLVLGFFCFFFGVGGWDFKFLTIHYCYCILQFYHLGSLYSLYNL